MDEKQDEQDKRTYNRLNGLLFLTEDNDKGFVGRDLGSGFYLVGLPKRDGSMGAYVRYAWHMEGWEFFESEEQREEEYEYRMKLRENDDKPILYSQRVGRGEEGPQRIHSVDALR